MIFQNQCTLTSIAIIVHIPSSLCWFLVCSFCFTVVAIHLLSWLQNVSFKSIRFAMEIIVVSRRLFLSLIHRIMQRIYMYIGAHCDSFAHYLLKCILITRKINIWLQCNRDFTLYFRWHFLQCFFCSCCRCFWYLFYIIVLSCLVVRFICGMSLTIKISGFNVLCRSVFNIFLLLLLFVLFRWVAITRWKRKRDLQHTLLTRVDSNRERENPIWNRCSAQYTSSIQLWTEWLHIPLI